MNIKLENKITLNKNTNSMKVKNRKKLCLFVLLGMLGIGGVNAYAADTTFPNSYIQKSPINVKGTIVDDQGSPLIGVSVRIKGTSLGTITDFDGHFSLKCPTNATLTISYVGYQSQELKVTSSSPLRITMKEDTKTLDEVIVIGYGTTSKKSAVGAVDQIRSERLENRPVANVSQALQGASPNLVIQQKNFNPNDDSGGINLNIRGISTTNNNSPLVVIDGLVSDVSSFNKLNPNDIKSVSVLKDAGTAAIYGSRSSNGVILVTTKNGQLNSRPIVKFQTMVGLQAPDLLFHTVKGYQNATLKNTALINGGMSPIYSPEQIRDLAAHQQEEKWFYDELFRTGLQQNYNVSVAGGGKHSTYMVSVGYYNQESNYVGNDDLGIQRYNVRTNLTTQLGPVKLSSILAYTRNDNTSTTGSSLEIDASRLPSYYYYKIKENGKYLLNDVLSEFTPFGNLEAGGVNKYHNNYLNANFNADWEIIKGLHVKGVFGVELNANHRFTRRLEVPYYMSGNDKKPAHISNQDRETSDWNYNSLLFNTQFLIDYKTTIGKHKISTLLGATNESFTGRSNEIRMIKTHRDLGTSAGDDTEIVVGGGSHTSLEDETITSITSYLGRLGYSFADRYYAEFSFRYDGSSKFSKDYRWGFFPSVSLGWRLSEEPFMAKYKENIGDLKIRSSYGILGNQSIGVYDRYTRYQLYSNNYAYNNSSVTGAGFTQGMDKLTWEKTKTFNIGIDASALNNHLNLSFDVYNKLTTDILMRPVVPSVMGTSMPMDNIGEMSNTGWELSINYRFKTGDFKHNLGLNIGDSFNKVKSFPGYEQIRGIEELSLLIREGVPLNSYYGYKVAGIFQNYADVETAAKPVGAKVQPGDLKYVDRNGDGVIDPNDRFILGNAFPRYNFGVNYSMNWKGLDFSMLWQGVGKRDMMVRGELIEPFHANYSYTIYKHQLDFWTPTNTDAKYPRLTAPGSDSNTNNYRNGSDLYILDGSYIRLKNITLGYTLPRNWCKKVGANKVRFYVTGQNLLTFTKNSFIDPESTEFGTQMSNNGANSGRNYPTLKYYGLGLEVEF